MAQKRQSQARRPRYSEPTEVDIKRGKDYAAWQIAARSLKGWNKARLAEATGYSDTLVGLFESDGIETATGRYRRPKEVYIRKVAEVTGADVNAGLAAAGHQADNEDADSTLVIHPGKRFKVRPNGGKLEIELVADKDLMAWLQAFTVFQDARRRAG
jgi:transcriptional regulator with XRE-family HTH domain